jgi:gliding motility-associated-like protein
MLLSFGCSKPFLFYSRLSLKEFSLTIYCFLLLLPAVLFAEGSKEITANGGFRPYLYSSTLGNSSFPFPTLGTMKVYVKAGETINVGSSAQGFGSGTINLRAPDGTTYTSGNSTTIGLISNRNQELAGPLPNIGGYTPYTKTVIAGQDGVWEIDFISQSNGVDAAWTQPSGTYVTAFDVSVRDAGNTHFLIGRVFTNVFSGILGTFNVGFNGIFNVLTKDGYQYTMNNNGQAGNGFTFFVNNKGFRNTDGTASYKSIDNVNNPNVQDPRVADSPTDITQKIFFNSPATDLPSLANTPGNTTTWLLNSPVLPSVTNIVFTGAEGTIGKAGTSPLGGDFMFTTASTGTYIITIDVNKNGTFTDPIDRKLNGIVVPGANIVFWDGLDGLGNKVPAANAVTYASNITITAKAGEVHFPFFDVERNVNGIVLTRTNGNFVPNDTLYWDDTPITIVGTPSNPIKNLTGISSHNNGHKWGTAVSDPLDDQDFGNNKSMDTWAYISTAPILNSVSFLLQEADLEVTSVAGIATCSGQPVIFTVVVKNNGPNDVAGAKFHFNIPAQVVNASVNSVSTMGSSATSAVALTASSYDANIDMANSSIRTFTINGIIAKSATGSLNLSASILRPADVTDPDATNPDAAPPTDPVNECNALPSGTGCNNIKTAVINFISTPVAGIGKTVFQNTVITLTGTGTGTWSQVTGNPSAVVFTNPQNASTTLAGLSIVGIYYFVYANAGNCADTIAINVISTNLVIPNIFTPNNDGKNDLFVIGALESYPGSQLLIFNRWGNEVYRADNYLNNWNGSGLAEGTYYYILNRREHTGDITTFKGWVFLKRSK